MQSVLNPPVVAHGVGKLLRVRLQAGKVETLLDGCCPCQGARGFDHPDTLESRPSCGLESCVDLVSDPIAAGLAPAMASLVLFIVITGGAVRIRLWPGNEEVLDR